MNFINQLKITSDTKAVNSITTLREGYTFRMFESIKINNDTWISIQASYGHYCSPRTTLEDLSEYSCMEFALMSKEGNFLSVREVSPDFPKLNDIENYSNGSTYGFVPVDLIDELFEFLKAKLL